MTEADKTAAAAATQDLQAQLDALAAHDADRFDPVRFRYLEAMARRVRAQPTPVASRLENNALKALRRYRQDFQRARRTAEALLVRVGIRAPERSKPLRRLVRQGEFQAATKLTAKLERADPVLHSLRALRNRLNGASGSQQLQPAGLDALLQQQEEAIVRAYAASSAAVPVASAPDRPIHPALALMVAGPEPLAPHEDGILTLKSIRHYRATQSNVDADQRVTRAIAERPNDAGPLNSHRLAIRSLALMRELSPQYLKRFVGYMDTLFWLEQAGAAQQAKRDKKAGRQSKKGR